MSKETTRTIEAIETWTCDVCGKTEETTGHVPEGWDILTSTLAHESKREFPKEWCNSCSSELLDFIRSMPTTEPTEETEEEPEVSESSAWTDDSEDSNDEENDEEE